MNPSTNSPTLASNTSKKLPHINGMYWALVVSSTTLGETAGDFISQTLDFGYGGASAVLLALFVIATILQVLFAKQHAWMYWTTLTLASIGGTTLCDWITRSLGLGYPLGSLTIFISLVATLSAWKWWTRSRDLGAALDKIGESLYWLTILTSSTFGTVLGDMLSKNELDLDGQTIGDTLFGEFVTRHGFGLGGIGFGDTASTIALLVLLAAVAVVTLKTRVSRVSCYWGGIIVTHPLGAAAGDFMTKDDGLHLGNAWATLLLVVVLTAVAVIAYRNNKKQAATLAA